jgi:hypothetical protein
VFVNNRRYGSEQWRTQGSIQEKQQMVRDDHGFRAMLLRRIAQSVKVTEPLEFMKIIFYLAAIVLGVFGVLAALNVFSRANLPPLQFLIPAVVVILAFIIFRKARARGW